MSGWPSESRDCDWERNLEASEAAGQSRVEAGYLRQRARLQAHVPDKSCRWLTFGEHDE
jgi:hypothetical protein